MNLAEMMKENDIELEWLFTLAKLDDKEGLMYFEPVTDEVDEHEVTNLAPKCLIVDGSKFVYDEDMDTKIIVNTIDDVITFTRIDGIQINIDTKQITGFPFTTAQFKDIPFEAKETEIPEDYVEVT